MNYKNAYKYAFKYHSLKTSVTEKIRSARLSIRIRSDLQPTEGRYSLFTDTG